MENRKLFIRLGVEITADPETMDKILIDKSNTRI